MEQNGLSLFSRYYPRRLTAEQLVDALSDLTGIRENFASVPPGVRATQLPAPDLKIHDREKIGDIEFLKVFGMPELARQYANVSGVMIPALVRP